MVNQAAASEPAYSNGLFKAAQMLARAIDWLAAIFGRISGALIFACSVVVIVDIVARLLGFPTLWGYDTTVYIMIVFVFLSLAHALKIGGHINVDLVVEKMNPRMRELMSIIGLFVTLVFTAVFSRYVFMWAIKSIIAGDRGSGMMRYFLWPGKLTAAIGITVLAIMALRLLISKSYALYRTRKETHYGAGISNPWITIPIFVVLVAAGVYLLYTSPIAGVFFLLVVLLASGTPIAFSIGTVALAAFVIYVGGERALIASPSIPYDFVNKYTLVSLPLFIFAGNIMTRSGLGAQLFRVASAYVGHIPGGLAVAAVIACAIFAAISGSSAANALTIGAIAFPVLVSHGYSKKMAAGLIAAAGGLGILIPPSNSFIMYGIMTDVSIGQLFIAGLLPGIMLTVMLAVCAVVVAKTSGQFQPMPKVSWKERLITTKDCVWVLLMPVVILGGIYGGFTTVTEAAAVSVAYSLIYALASRQIKFTDIPKLLAESTRSVAFILMIIMCAIMIAFAVTMLQVPDKLGDALSAAGIPGWGVIVIFMVFIMFLGMFLEGASIALLTIPITTPILERLGFDLIWYAVLLTINVELAMITPPVGINVFIMQHIAKIPSSQVFRGVVIFGSMVLLAMIIVGVAPQVALWLPDTMRR